MSNPHLNLAVSNDMVPVEDGASAQLPAPLTPPDVAWAASEESAPIEVVALFKAISRLEEVVEQETASLRSGQTPPLEEFNYRKSHGLLELTRAMRALDANDLDLRVRDRLEDLRDGLERNRTMLKTHLDAAREISTILTTAIREAESDGTYSVPPGMQGRPQ